MTDETTEQNRRDESDNPLAPPVDNSEAEIETEEEDHTPANTRIIEDPSVDTIEDDEDLLDDYPTDAPEIELVHLRISSIRALNLARFTHVQKLCLRQNHISEIECLSTLAPTLVDLDLYDNNISHIHGLEDLSSLQNLDLSFNNIKHIKRISHLSDLRNLYFVQNRISRIENLEGLAHLRNLELGANRIRCIENIAHLNALEELWLGKNKITQLSGLSTLSNLKILSIQSNRLTTLSGLEGLSALEELYVSYNALTRLSGLESNTGLRVLDVSNNRISRMEGVKHLGALEELWASGNELGSFEDIQEELGGLEALVTVYFEGNPLVRAAGAAYRTKVRLALPGVKQIDASFVRV